MIAAVIGPLLTLGVWLATATPSPTDTKNLSDPVDVSPGLGGFLATFAIAVVTILLVIDMNRRIRRLRFRERQAEEARRAATEADD